MKIDRRVLSAALSLLPTVCLAQSVASSPNVCQSQQDGIKQVADKYKVAFDGYQKEGDDLKKDAATFNVEVTWGNQEIIFDTPSVTVRDQRLVFGVPQVTMKTRDIVFATPSVRMKRVKTGQYPEFYCDTHTVVPKCTTRWSDIFMDVPETFMQEQHIKMDIPEFKWADTQIIMGIPEFFMQRQRWVIGVPEFKLTSVVINAGPLKAKSEDLQRKVSATKAAEVKEMGSAIHAVFVCHRESVGQQRTAVAAQFTSAIAQMDGVIQSLKAQGADPTNVAGADGTSNNLVAKRDELVQQRDTALANFDDALRHLDDGEKEAIAKIQGVS